MLLLLVWSWHCSGAAPCCREEPPPTPSAAQTLRKEWLCARLWMPPPRPPLPWRTLADLDFPALRHLQALASSRYPTPRPPPPAAPPPSSAVSLLSFAGQTGPCVLLLRKTGRGRHAAQLCLPGGFADDGDGGDLWRTCLRELVEETGLGPGPDGWGQVELLGQGPLQGAREGLQAPESPRRSRLSGGAPPPSGGGSGRSTPCRSPGRPGGG